jgi:superfamily II DNA or RNA helicase
MGDVFFHGGVPGRKRKDLVRRFKEDKDCRAFLATDAGGVGLNLQHANVVVNLDLPWNPAVLEQRIGRVHRLGQTQPVRVVNLRFRGTYRTRDAVVVGIQKVAFFRRARRRREGSLSGEEPPQQLHGDGRAAAEPPDPFTGLLQQGVALLEQLARAAQGPASSSRDSAPRSVGGVQVVQDERDQQPYLRIPLPKPEAVGQALAALQNLVQSLRNPEP